MSDLDQKKLEAEIANLQAQAAKTEAERKSLSKSWQDWLLEATKLVGALVLGLGGITAAITGYQLSEVKKERTDFETVKAQEALKDLNQQKAVTLQQLASINQQIETLQTNLKAARNSQPDKAALLDEAINNAANIGNAIATTKAQLRATGEAVAASPPTSDYLVGLQTLGLDDAGRNQLNDKIRNAGYSLHALSYSYEKNQRPPWFAPKSAVLYYSDSALPAAKQLAGVMKQLVGSDFVVQRGSGLGVDPAQRDVTLFVQYIRN